MQEATDRVVEDGDLVAFDTDLIGERGYLTDISRTYVCGDGRATDEQRRLYQEAHAYLHDSIPEFRPGASFQKLGHKLGPRLPDEFQALRYPIIAHGCGLIDEYPCVKLDQHHEGEIEAGMVMSVEAFVGAAGGSQGVKLEEQIIIGDDGPKMISEAPYESDCSPECPNAEVGDSGVEWVDRTSARARPSRSVCHPEKNLPNADRQRAPVAGSVVLRPHAPAEEYRAAGQTDSSLLFDDGDVEASGDRNDARGEAGRRARSALEADIRAGRFVLTASLGTLKGIDGSLLRRRLRDLRSRFRFVKFGDNPRARARPSPWAAAAVAIDEGLEPVVHVTCRDRNRLAIAADLLGGRMLGVHNVLCLRGDEIEVSDDDRARAVRDLDVVELIRLAGEIGEGDYFLLAACDPEVGATAAYFGRLADKLAAGALVLETQPIFEPDRFATWLGRLRDAGIDAPVLVDLFVVTRPEQAASLRDVPFITVPEWLEDRLRRDEAAGVVLAAEIVAAVRELPGVAGCHLSSFGGLAEPPLEIADLVGFDARDGGVGRRQ